MSLIKSEAHLPAPQMFVPPPRPPARQDGPAQTLVTFNSFFVTLQEARDALFAQEERRGFQWKVSKTHVVNGVQRKLVVKCRRSGVHMPVHAPDLDPGQLREGKSVKTGCLARANIGKLAGGWYISRYDEAHNHERELPVGGTARRPPTKEQKELIAKLDATGNFTRRDVGSLLQMHDNLHNLEPRQISNVLNGTRKEKREVVNSLGGDVGAILALLDEAIEHGEMWNRRMLIDEIGVCVGVWWQSPTQADLARRFHNLVLNDNSYNRNQYQYPLNLGIAIDNQGKSRNIWYALHLREDTETHIWVLRCHLEFAGRAPEAFFSDRSAALMAACAQVFPETRHFICLHHMLGNIVDHVRPGARARWDFFLRLFWSAYRAVSPDEFERLWGTLVSEFPGCRAYLQNELYPSRRLWAWAWVGKEFTAGIRTNGRVEAENRINKALGGPKKTFLELFNALNKRTLEQTKEAMNQFRLASRQKHAAQIESIFPGPLSMLRTYAGPFAVQTSYRQMEASMFYACDPMPKPQGREAEPWVRRFFIRALLCTDLSLRMHQWFAAKMSPVLNGTMSPGIMYVQCTFSLADH